jgi:hypothetical protein
MYVLLCGSVGVDLHFLRRENIKLNMLCGRFTFKFVEGILFGPH